MIFINSDWLCSGFETRLDRSRKDITVYIQIDQNCCLTHNSTYRHNLNLISHMHSTTYF